MEYTLTELQEIMNKYHLCTFYVLPLIGLSGISFGEENFINSYVTKDLSHVGVKVRHLNLVPKEPLHLAIRVQNSDLLFYRIPQIWQQDLQVFRKGLYSKMGSAAKDLIKKFSGLPSGMEENINPDYRLLALDKSPILREYLERSLDMYLSPEDELLSLPNEEQFIENPLAL